MAGASLEASDTAEESAEEASDTAELIADSAEETADDTAGASDDAGAAEDDGAGASLELTAAELEGSTGVTGVGVPRLKIQMRPMITITATMMIIQVLRFILLALFWRSETGSLSYALTLCRLPYTRLAILIRR
jgi:hypothetical protein